MNYIITLTGGIGYRKTTAANILRKLKINIIDSDKIRKKITKSGKPTLKTIINKFDIN
ncbi:hypothetical protein C9I82_099 [Candidatus Purcelliella pentastirinorum]|uniref:Dephospho-CoA kinase n=1 Tax=Candidatus Purcelliella pentastirinorum TaxID=472834 RepID=A0A346DZC1_9ENTR|nr:dephospho-CoA kinase [Candidatus Purcelliella pentastirinorum]AXN02076.1 hypothetical protein C9I82_099 [Candidatus Purcelliella pentastirinorum]